MRTILNMKQKSLSSTDSTVALLKSQPFVHQKNDV